MVPTETLGSLVVLSSWLRTIGRDPGRRMGRVSAGSWRSPTSVKRLICAVQAAYARYKMRSGTGADDDVAVAPALGAERYLETLKRS